MASKKTRRIKGDGSIFQRKGKWIAQVVIGYDSKGKAKKVTKTCATKPDAATALRKLMLKKATSQLTLHGKTPFSMYAERWLEQKSDLTEKTLMEYDRFIHSYFIPFFGRCSMGQITTSKVNDYIDHFVKKGYAPATLTKMKVLLHSIFEQAAAEDIIGRNPTIRSTKIKKEYNDVPYIPHDDMMKILKAARDVSTEAMEKHPRNSKQKNLYAFALTAYHTGMRLGELLGLTWSNIDVEKRQIHVCQALTEVRDLKTKKITLKVVAPKRNSIRTITVSKDVLQALAELQEDGKDVVFRNRKDGFFYPTNFSTVWRDLLKQAGMLGKYKIHEIRHTHATEAVAYGNNIKSVSRRLGHKDSRTTLNNYAAAIPEADFAIADFFQGKK